MENWIFIFQSVHLVGGGGGGVIYEVRTLKGGKGKQIVDINLTEFKWQIGIEK